MPTKRQIAADWIAEGGPANAAGLMAEIAWSESGGNDHAVSRTGCVGRYQLCPPPADAYDGRANTRHAIAKWANGSGHGNWTNFNGKAASLHQRWLRNPHAFDYNVPSGASASNTRNAGSFLNPFNFDPLNPLKPGIPDLGGGIPNPLAGIDTVAKAVTDLVNTIRDIFDWLTSSETWLNLGKIMIGFFLAAMGLRGAWKVATR